MSELIPYTTINTAQNHLTGLEISHQDSLLTREERDLIVRYITINLAFLPHGVLPEDMQRVDEILNTHEPTSTVLLCEGVSGSSSGTDVGDEAPTNAFDYAESLAATKGIQFFSADMSSRLWSAWQQTKAYSDTESAQDTPEMVYQLLTRDFFGLGFFEAAAQYSVLQRTVDNESAFHDYRERIAANTLKSIALHIAKWHNKNDNRGTTTIILLYGPYHQAPIEERLRQFNIPYNSSNYTNTLESRSTAPHMLTPNDVYQFARHFFFGHTLKAHTKPLDEAAQQRLYLHISHQVAARSLSELRDTYEVYRRYIAGHSARPAHELKDLLFSVSINIRFRRQSYLLSSSHTS